jgi:MFS family permease
MSFKDRKSKPEPLEGVLHQEFDIFSTGSPQKPLTPFGSPNIDKLLQFDEILQENQPTQSYTSKDIPQHQQPDNVDRPTQLDEKDLTSLPEEPEIVGKSIEKQSKSRLQHFIDFLLWINLLCGMSAFWFGYNYAWTANGIIFPSQVTDVVGLELKEFYYSFIPILGSVAHMITTPIFGYFSDDGNNFLSRWFGRRRLWILIFLFPSCALFMANAFFTSPSDWGIWVIMCCGIGVQITMAGCAGPYGGLLPDLIPKEKHGIASGVQALFLTLGTLVGALGAGLLMQYLPNNLKYWVTYAYLATGLLASGMYTVIGVRERPVKMDKTMDTKQIKKKSCRDRVMTFLRLFYFPPRKYLNFYWIMAGTLSLFVGVNLILPYLQFFLSDIVKVDNPALMSSFILATLISVAAMGTIIGGIMTDRVGPKSVIFFGCTLLLAALVVDVIIIILNLTQLWVFFLSSSVMGMGFGMNIAAATVLSISVVPVETIAKDLALQNQLVNIGQIVGSSIAGAIVGNLKKISYTLAYAVLFSLSGMFILLAILCIFPIKTELVGSWRKGWYDTKYEPTIEEWEEKQINEKSKAELPDAIIVAKEEGDLEPIVVE